MDGIWMDDWMDDDDEKQNAYILCMQELTLNIKKTIGSAWKKYKLSCSKTMAGTTALLSNKIDIQPIKYK